MVREQIDQRNRERGEIKGHFGGIPIEIFDSDAELIRRMAALSAIDPELRIVPCTRHKKFGRDLAPLLLIEADRYEESGNERVASELRQLAEV